MISIKKLLRLVLVVLVVVKICIAQQHLIDLEELFRQAEDEYYKQSHQLQKNFRLKRDTKSMMSNKYLNY